MVGADTVETRASGGNYRALFEQSIMPMALLAMREEPHFVAASQGFLDAFDLGDVTVAGRPLSEVLVTEGDGLASVIDRCLLTSESQRAHVELSGSSGRRVIGLAVHSGGARGFAQHVVLEADPRSRAIGPTVRRYSAVLDRAGISNNVLSFIHCLRSRRVRYADGGLATRFGFTSGRMRTEEYLARIHPDDVQNLLPAAEAARQALNDDEFVSQTVRVRDIDGEWRLLNIRSKVLRRSPDGAARLMAGTATDVTEYAAAAVHAAEVSVLRAEENERARIGRELHDSTSQYLVAADLGLARVLSSRGLSPDERARLRGVQASLATAQTEMRAFSYFLHPPELRELGLHRTLEKFCTGFGRRSGLDVAFTSHEATASLPTDAEHALFRVAQEALMNIYRHSFARRVSVALDLKDGALSLDVRDDGIGMDDILRLENAGVGIAGMKARMLSVGGELRFEHLHPGLAVVATVPMPTHWGDRAH